MKLSFIDYVIYIDNIGVAQPRRRLGLHLKFADKTSITAEFLLQHLDCHQTVQLMAFCLVNLRHPAGAHLFQHLITVLQVHPGPKHHKATSPISGHIRTTEILSRPPPRFAASTKASAFALSPSSVRMIYSISSSSTILLRPSEHIRI